MKLNTCELLLPPTVCIHKYFEIAEEQMGAK